MSAVLVWMSAAVVACAGSVMPEEPVTADQAADAPAPLHSQQELRDPAVEAAAERIIATLDGRATVEAVWLTAPSLPPDFTVWPPGEERSTRLADSAPDLSPRPLDLKAYHRGVERDRGRIPPMLVLPLVTIVTFSGVWLLIGRRGF